MTTEDQLKKFHANCVHWRRN